MIIFWRMIGFHFFCARRINCYLKWSNCFENRFFGIVLHLRKFSDLWIGRLYESFGPLLRNYNDNSTNSKKNYIKYNTFILYTIFAYFLLLVGSKKYNLSSYTMYFLYSLLIHKIIYEYYYVLKIKIFLFCITGCIIEYKY